MRDRRVTLRSARRHSIRFPLLVLVALCGCSYALVSGGSVNLTKARQIEERLQSLRGLAFKRPVPTVVMTADEAELVMLDEIHRDYSDERLKIDGESGAMIGLYPPGTDLKAETLKLLKDQIAGFYEPHRKEMILIQGAVDIGFRNRISEFMIQRDLVGEMLLAHELTHALQDQHFGVDEKLESLKDNDDRQLAMKSVAEGDATLAGLGFVQGKTDDATVDDLVGKLGQLPEQFADKSNGAPEALSTPLIYQYSSGARFVAQAFHRGGWKAVDQLYVYPPQSSQQIMHPVFYFNRPVSPAVVTLSGYQTVLAGWQKVEENTFGELLLQVILKRNLGRSAPELRLADRWAGDRIVVLRIGRSLTVLWLILFSEDQSAQQFKAAYMQVLDRVLGRGTAHEVEARSSEVLVAVGEGATHYRELGPAVWKDSTVKRPSPVPPPPIRATNERVQTMTIAAAAAQLAN
jgi:hypothetical protein